jgi:flagellar motor switch protein FliM
MQEAAIHEPLEAAVTMATAKDKGFEVKETRSIRPCTFTQSAKLASDRLTALAELHAGFARSLSHTLAAYLRTSCEVTLTSTEQLTFGAFLAQTPALTYMMCILVDNNTRVAVQIDSSLVFPLVDILLGGGGRCDVLQREVSEIEEEIMADVGTITCRELEDTWKAMGARLDLEGRKPAAAMQRLLSPAENVLRMRFTVRLAETDGRFNVVLPVSLSNTLLRSISAQAAYKPPRVTDRTREQLSATMLDCSFRIELGIPAIKIDIQTLMHLVPQSICNLGVPVKKPASLLIAGREIFDATPARHGRLRVAQLGRKMILSNEKAND